MKTNYKKSKHQKRATALNKMTPRMISKMKIMNAFESVKLLFDSKSNNYVIYDNYNLSSYYTNNHRLATRFFQRRIDSRF